MSNEDENYDDDQQSFVSFPVEIQNWEEWCNEITSTCAFVNFDPWECECEVGWIPILEILFHYADEWNKCVTSDGANENDEIIRIYEVKEKYDGLRFYYSGGKPEFRGMVEMAEMMSTLLCGCCGQRKFDKKKANTTTDCPKCKHITISAKNKKS